MMMGDYGGLYATDVKRSAEEQIWFRYYISTDVPRTAKLEIRDFAQNLVRTIDGLGARPRGHYDSRSRAIFWNRRTVGDDILAAGRYTVTLFLSAVQQDWHWFLLSD